MYYRTIEFELKGLIFRYYLNFETGLCYYIKTNVTYYFTSCNTSKRVPGNTALLVKTSQRWRAVGNTLSDQTGPRFEPQTSRSIETNQSTLDQLAGYIYCGIGWLKNTGWNLKKPGHNEILRAQATFFSFLCVIEQFCILFFYCTSNFFPLRQIRS